MQLSISNFDHATFTLELEAALRAHPKYEIEHFAYDHHGRLWYDEDGRFYEEVSVYGAVQATLAANTLAELIKLVNDTYGWE